MYLVDEDDDVGILLDFLDECLDALFELSAVFGSCHDGGEVEAHEAFVEQHGRCLALGDELCQSFDDGAFTDARLADEYGVVLLSAAENFCHTLYLALASHDGVELSFEGSSREIDREVIEHGGLSATLACLCGRMAAVLLLVARVLSDGFEFFLVFIGEPDAALWHVGFLLEIFQGVLIVHFVEF